MTSSNVDRIEGHVQRLVPDKGYFFIRDSAGQDYFGHGSELLNVELAKLQRGDVVTFLPTVHPTKGPRAVEIEWHGADGHGNH